MIGLSIIAAFAAWAAVSNDNVTKLIQPGEFDDQLTEILRNGARALLAQAVDRLQKAGIPRDLMAAYIRSPTTLRTHTIRAEEKTAVPRSAR